MYELYTDEAVRTPPVSRSSFISRGNAGLVVKTTHWVMLTRWAVGGLRKT